MSTTYYVTPYVGVWIETRLIYVIKHSVKVTPYVGVWIETKMLGHTNIRTTQSLLMWECGLKHDLNRIMIALKESLLMWECGLKLDMGLGKTVTTVTPYVGVWIETRGQLFRATVPN